MHGGDETYEGLNAAEVRAFAEVFADPATASQLLDNAGLPRRAQPSWGTSSSEAFWSEVSRLLANGKVERGRERLLERARQQYPDNRVFDGGPLRPTVVVRTRPAADLLPALPARFVPREDDLAAVRTLLADPAGSPVVGLVGMGGAGKSTLARAVVHDTLVTDAFPDGVLWVEVGPKPDLTATVWQVLAGFGAAQRVVDLAEGTARVRTWLAGAACLVVLDNVWDVDVLRSLPVSGRCRLLVTTRSRDALFSDSAVYPVGTVGERTARQVLARYAGREMADLPHDADELVARCGGLVLALALIGGMVAEGRPWANVVERLRRSDLRRLVGRFADYPHPDLLAALDVSVSALDSESGRLFHELAVFEGRGPVPAALVVRLWQVSGAVDDLDADDLLRLLARRSLVEIDSGTDTVTLHDLLFDYARGSLPAGRLSELHGMVADDLLDGWGGLGGGLEQLRGRHSSTTSMNTVCPRWWIICSRRIVRKPLTPYWPSSGPVGLAAWTTPGTRCTRRPTGSATTWPRSARCTGERCRNPGMSPSIPPGPIASARRWSGRSSVR